MNNNDASIWEQLINNRVLICGLVAWFLAQFLKPFIYLVITRRWSWGLWFTTGKMPSSHSALVVGTSTAVGLYRGFETAEFAICVALSMIVLYDAAGVRRQAGYHAQKINLLLEELFSGQPISEKRLKEVLGHTPREVFGGALLGILVPVIIWASWH
jgi:acid phosphatase family membrane protein YuiD